MENTTQGINLASIQVLFFDLDDTLYPRSSGVWELIRQRIDRFLVEGMHFTPEEVPELRHRLWRQYGTTLRGLQAEFAVDMDTYLAYVHDVPLHTIPSPDLALQQVLTALPQRKLIFTNSDAAHAQRVTERLGVTDQFEAVIDIHTVAPYCKPQPEAFHIALEACGEAPEHCLLMDDAPRNLATAKTLGMATVSVGEHRHDGSPHVEDLRELTKFLG